MPGLVPGIHVFSVAGKEDVDGRNKLSHDEGVDEIFPASSHFHLLSFLVVI